MRAGALAFTLVTSAACSSASAPARPADLGGLACDQGRGAKSQVAGFTRYALESTSSGPAFVTAADVNGDGRPDLIMSEFGTVAENGAQVTLGPGAVWAYLQGDTLGCWHKQAIVTHAAGLYFPNQTTAADIDGDGDIDLVLATGFFVCGFDTAVRNCGTLSWLENQGGGQWRPHPLIGTSDGKFYTKGVLVDLDGDGILDIVTVGETSSDATTRWLKGDRTSARFAAQPTDIGEGLGSLPVVRDVDGDGTLDIASAEYFYAGASFAWFQHAAAGWTRHVINADSGGSISLQFVPDLYGDGVLRGVGTNHTNTTSDPAADTSSVYVLTPPADTTQLWPKTRISSGIVSRANVGSQIQAAPGVFGFGDIDGDGDIDLAVAGDGDQRTFWLEQTAPGQFTTHTIETSLGQAAGALVTDLNQDGKNELVFSGYEDGALYVYTR